MEYTDKEWNNCYKIIKPPRPWERPLDNIDPWVDLDKHRRDAEKEIRKLRRQIEEMRQNSSKTTHVGIVLDCSGSMELIKDSVIKGFNEQVDSLRSEGPKGGNTRVAFSTFSTHVRPVFYGKTPEDIRYLTNESYNPNGWTALYDAVGQMVSRLEAEESEGDTGFLVIVVSDGNNNRTYQWSGDALGQKIRSLEATGKWTFVYVGANQNLNQVRGQLNLQRGNLLDFAPTAAGYAVMSASVSTGTKSYFNDREQGITATKNFVKTDSQE